jgi:translation initiation factor 5B
VRLEEERIAAEEKAAADERERRRKAKLDKKEAQVAAGTFMTKAEKEKAKKQQARLDALKAAGMQIPSPAADPAAAATVKASDLYKKPLNAKNGGENKPAAAAAAPVKEVEPVKEAAPAPAATEVADDWDADDDWESNLEQIQLNLEVRAEQAADDVEVRQQYKCSLTSDSER